MCLEITETFLSVHLCVQHIVDGTKFSYKHNQLCNKVFNQVKNH